VEHAATQVSDDAIGQRLLAAAARVFARQGYAGTKIQDIVREAGLSTGAIYGRFGSKNDLLRAAVIQRTAHAAELGTGDDRVADLLQRLAELRDAPLEDGEAIRLEAFVAARREPEVADALGDAHGSWRAAVQPLVDAALADGTVAADVDIEAVLYFLRTVHLGLLLQRGAGLPAPDPDAWNDLISRVVASFGDGDRHPRSEP
jgi:AcrR family transcriptional regulator